jgi:hemerythrin-like metal-binding protein
LEDIAMAAFFEWDPEKFSLQIPQMDEEHMLIVNCMNRLHELNENHANRAALGAALEELVRITARHFADEEMYMKKIGFPDAARHGLIHTQLLERIHQFHQGFKTSGALTEDFFYFLKMWLKSHICGIDTKYAAHSQAA